VTAGADEAATDPPPPPHPVSVAANKQIAARQHHTRNRFLGKRTRSRKEWRGPGFKQPYFLSQGNSENKYSDSELRWQDVPVTKKVAERSPRA